jgi:polar amino acid transport system substrate-binding protein
LRIILLIFLFLFNNSSLLARELNIDTIEIYPFGYIGADGNNTGMIYEIGNIIAKTAGFTYTNRLRPYPRTIVDLKNGNADFIIRYSNPELLKESLPVTPILGFNSIIIGKVGHNFKSLNDLQGKMIGVIRGGVFSDKSFEDKAILKYEVKDYEQSFNMLLANKLDAIIGSTIGLNSTAKKMKIAKTQLGLPLMLEKKYFILFLSKKKADPQTIIALKNAVEKLNKSTVISKIVEKYE